MRKMIHGTEQTSGAPRAAMEVVQESELGRDNSCGSVIQHSRQGADNYLT